MQEYPRAKRNHSGQVRGRQIARFYKSCKHGYNTKLIRSNSYIRKMILKDRNRLQLESLLNKTNDDDVLTYLQILPQATPNLLFKTQVTESNINQLSDYQENNLRGTKKFNPFMASFLVTTKILQEHRKSVDQNCPSSSGITYSCLRIPLVQNLTQPSVYPKTNKTQYITDYWNDSSVRENYTNKITINRLDRKSSTCNRELLPSEGISKVRRHINQSPFINLKDFIGPYAQMQAVYNVTGQSAVQRKEIGTSQQFKQRSQGIGSRSVSDGDSTNRSAKRRTIKIESGCSFSIHFTDRGKSSESSPDTETDTKKKKGKRKRSESRVPSSSSEPETDTKKKKNGKRKSSVSPAPTSSTEPEPDTKKKKGKRKSSESPAPTSSTEPEPDTKKKKGKRKKSDSQAPSFSPEPVTEIKNKKVKRNKKSLHRCFCTTSFPTNDQNLINKPCDPGVCVPGQCTPKECFQRLQQNGSQASQTKKKRKKDKTILKEKGSSSISKYVESVEEKVTPPKKKENLIATCMKKCCKRCKFWKKDNRIDIKPAVVGTDISVKDEAKTGSNAATQSLEKAITKKDKRAKRKEKIKVSETYEVKTKTKSTSKKSKNTRPLKPYECEPGVCSPKVCNPKECFDRKYPPPPPPKKVSSFTIFIRKLCCRRKAAEEKTGLHATTQSPKPVLEKPPGAPVYQEKGTSGPKTGYKRGEILEAPAVPAAGDVQRSQRQSAYPGIKYFQTIDNKRMTTRQGVNIGSECECSVEFYRTRF